LNAVMCPDGMRIFFLLNVSIDVHGYGMDNYILYPLWIFPS
jgi:hypothetical protein